VLKSQILFMSMLSSSKDTVEMDVPLAGTDSVQNMATSESHTIAEHK
jgi:hypothetical protein